MNESRPTPHSPGETRTFVAGYTCRKVSEGADGYGIVVPRPVVEGADADMAGELEGGMEPFEVGGSGHFVKSGSIAMTAAIAPIALQNVADLHIGFLVCEGELLPSYGGEPSPCGERGAMQGILPRAITVCS